MENTNITSNITNSNTNLNKDKCSNDINLPNYNTLRNDKLQKINTYYSNLLGSYTQSYKDYSNQSASGNVNDRLYAKNTLKPKVDNYNQQLITVGKNMIDNVNLDTDLIMEQKNELASKTRQIDTILNNITILKDKDNEMSVLTNARSDSLNSVKETSNDMNFYTYIYIGINILLLLIVLGVVIYIVYSSYSKSNNSNSKTANNIYKNIPVNV